MQTYKVLRQHFGDQFYDPAGLSGPAEREADPLAVAHLVSSGVLEAPHNKSMGDDPKKKVKAKAPESGNA